MREQRNLVGMKKVLGTIWAPEGPSPDMTAEAFIGQPDHAYEILMCIWLETSPRPTPMILIENDPEYFEALRFQRELIHESSPTLAERLFKSGVDANQLNSDGCTPMDSIIGTLRKSFFRTCAIPPCTLFTFVASWGSTEEI